MSVVAGIAKGLGVAGMIVGPILLVVGLVVAVGGLNDAKSCAEREDSFDRCNDAQGEVIQVQLIGGGISASAGAALALLGSLFFFIARGAERRAERVRPGSPLSSLDD